MAGTDDRGPRKRKLDIPWDTAVRGWRGFTGDVRHLAEERVPTADLTVMMQQASRPSLAFFLMLGLAAAIASLGLLSNSAAAIIGAMIIAPLMAPIMSVTFGLVIVDRSMILRSAIAIVAGVVEVVAIAYILTRIVGLTVAGSEIFARAAPSLLDLGVAMAAGAAAAFAYSRRSIMASIAGVAIAVALVPPLAVSGIGLALGRGAAAGIGLSLSEFGVPEGGVDIAIGAFILFATNLAGIGAAAALVFLLQRYGPWKKGLFGLVAAVVLGATLIGPLNRALYRMYIENVVMKLASTLPREHPDVFDHSGRLETLRVRYDGEAVRIHAVVFAAAARTAAERQESVELFADYLAEELGETVSIHFEMIPVEIEDLRALAHPITARQSIDDAAPDEGPAGAAR